MTLFGLVRIAMTLFEAVRSEWRRGGETQISSQMTALAA